MKSMWIVPALILLTMGCSGKKGWSQGDRDHLVNGCVTESSKSGNLDATKLKSYCSCYEQNLEKKYPSLVDLAKASQDDMMKEAEPCLPLIMK
ncbi:MAG: hypothetical protein U1F57_03085 [bacterium]